VTTPPFTQTWADAFRHVVNNDLVFRDAGRGWSAPLALVLDNGAPIGLIGPVAMEISMDGGVCQSARIISPDACTAPFVVRAGFETWRAILDGSLDPLAAVMRGEVSLTGELRDLMMHARAITALAQCARAVSNDYPDQPAA